MFFFSFNLSLVVVEKEKRAFRQGTRDLGGNLQDQSVPAGPVFPVNAAAPGGGDSVESEIFGESGRDRSEHSSKDNLNGLG